jgi:hypothetical protein
VDEADAVRLAAAGAVMVSVEVAPLEPGVTDAGLNPQVGSGAGPVTEHDS